VLGSVLDQGYVRITFLYSLPHFDVLVFGVPGFDVPGFDRCKWSSG